MVFFLSFLLRAFGDRLSAVVNGDATATVDCPELSINGPDKTCSDNEVKYTAEAENGELPESCDVQFSADPSAPVKLKGENDGDKKVTVKPRKSGVKRR